MTFHEMIAKFAAENIQWQRLDQCLIESRDTKNGLTRVTFGTTVANTTEIISGSNGGKMCLIVWLDGDDWAKMVAEHKAGKENS